MKQFEEAIKKLCNELPSVGLTNERADFIESLVSDLEHKFVAVKKKLREFDPQKWFDENVYEDWTWEGMLEKFIKKEILEE